MRSLVVFCCAVVLVTASRPVLAQQAKRLPLFALDVRGFDTRLKQDPSTAKDLNTDDVPISSTDLPLRGLGGNASATLYPLRGKGLSLGLGVDAVIIHGVAQQKATKGENGDPDTPAGPRIVQRLQGFSPSLSLNFGHRDGWSYVSAGMGPLGFWTYLGDTAPSTSPLYQMTINMGGGARWFSTAHVAFCFDLRFYLTRPSPTLPPYPGRSRERLLVLSGGISIR